MAPFYGWGGFNCFKARATSRSHTSRATSLPYEKNPLKFLTFMYSQLEAAPIFYNLQKLAVLLESNCSIQRMKAVSDLDRAFSEVKTKISKKCLGVSYLIQLASQLLKNPFLIQRIAELKLINSMISETTCHDII